MANLNRQPIERQLMRAAGVALLVAGGAIALQAANESPKANEAQGTESKALEAMERGRHGFDVLAGTVELAPGVNVRETPVIDNADGSSEDTQNNIAFRVDADGATLHNPLVYADDADDVWYGAQRHGSDDASESVVWVDSTQIEAEDPSKITITVDLGVRPSADEALIRNAVIEGDHVVSPSYPKGPLAVIEE